MQLKPDTKILQFAAIGFAWLATSFVCMAMAFNHSKIKITITPNQGRLITGTIQRAIDSCASSGGGTVFFPAGNYVTGGIQLKSKVTLLTEKGTYIKGSDNHRHYTNDALIFGTDLTGIAIEGAGVIDGVDCYNPDGEEGFRGPHGIRLVNCTDISIRDITIKNAANWAINCRHCSNAVVANVSIRGGHDGLHTRFCNHFTVSGCDFRTGDDAFAGNDNQNVTVTDCKINTSCNGFRFGCYNFTVKRCRFWGPGESVHKIQKRNNMLAAFVHFSPADDHPTLRSGNWLIDDITVENVDHFYVYNYPDGLWQTGQPATDIRFKTVTATGLLRAFSIVGDTARNFNLSIQNASFSFRDGAANVPTSFEGAAIQSAAFFNATNFNQITLQNVTIKKLGTGPVLNCASGNSLVLADSKLINGNSSIPYSISNVTEIKKDGLRLHTSNK